MEENHSSQSVAESRRSGAGVCPAGVVYRLREHGTQCGGAAVIAPHWDRAARGGALLSHSSSSASGLSIPTGTEEKAPRMHFFEVKDL